MLPGTDMMAAMMRPALLALMAAAAFGQSGARDWKPLFDGATLGQWKEAEFPRHPAVKVENGAIVMPAGQPFTGVTWTGEFAPREFELRFEAARLKGGDFFASVTFPAGGSFATLVLGGWGGDIVGISSIDGWDAADNETRRYFTFETGQWYAVRLQVTAERIRAWIDDRSVVNVEIAGRAIALRQADMKLSTPLGFCSYNTSGAVRKIEYRDFSPDGRTR